jgi:predicted O-methyltransferase YrrM
MHEPNIAKSDIFMGECMSRSTINMTDDLLAYVRSIGVREDADLRALREETAAHPRAQMQISAEQGQFMALLVELIGARKVVEVGTFTGYSAMWMSKAMGANGRIVCLDISAEFTSIAKRHWAQAGINDRIDLRLAPAAESLKAMIAAGETGQFDFAFIDADKTGYDTYYESALTLLRPGGLIAIDNVLWNGAVVDMSDQSADTNALRALNEKISKDARVTMSLVPIGDGLTLARKR